MQSSSVAISIQKLGRLIPVPLLSRSSHSMATSCCGDGASCPHAGRNSIRFAAGKVGARLEQLRRSETSRRAAARRCHDARGRPRAVMTASGFLPRKSEQVGSCRQQVTVSVIHVLARDRPRLYESDSLVLGSSSGSCAEPMPGRGAELHLRRDSATIGVRRLVVHEAAHVRLDGRDVQPSRDRGLRPPSSTSRRRTRVMQTRSAFSAYAIRTASA